MRTFELIENGLQEDEKGWYEKQNPGMKTTGDILRMGDEHSSCSYVVFTGKHTPYDCVRDCGDHWIHAGYEGYDRIDKGTFKFTKDYGDR